MHTAILLLVIPAVLFHVVVVGLTLAAGIVALKHMVKK